MPRRKSFAIVDIVEGRFHTMESAHASTELEGRYPPTAFQIVDMDGKDDIPFKEGATIQDLTIDANGDWKWKVTDLELQQRKNANRKDFIRNQLLDLLLKKEKADLQGVEFADVSASLQSRIDEIQAELAGL